MQIYIYIFIITLIAAPASALGEQPLEAVQRGFDKGISVLADPQYQDPSRRKEQEQKLWEITLEIFDFEELSRRILASHWKKFSSPQRKEFIKLIGEFLGKLNLPKLQSKYNGEKVFYIDQKIISKSKALVEIEILWKKLSVPVQLRMKKNHGKWKVYDLTALGVSAVSNYRAQIHQIMQKKSPDQVIEIFKEKIREKKKKIEIEEDV
ncbi:MAG: ABC transporter substrate-binding protein [Deltaproteobacteria bacterium]|jgi:phospholipid transport system substrate-binding protein|nr:ABC transporter substrate-binding protein [Deltaproteobacteria bacterium]MBW2491915.1 ABC transporter substrate-binding protein [Deltaproteobacteria bacterium]